MKTLILSVLLSSQIISSLANAGEESWVSSSQTLPTLQNEIVGFTTDTGAFRMTEARPGISEMEISGGVFKPDYKKAAARCKGYGKSLRTSKTLLKNVYRFKGNIYPFAVTELKNLRTAIQNTPSLSGLEVNLIALSADPIVTPQAAEDFKQRVEQQIWDQIDQVKSNGELSFDLEQVDDVACDLILGQSRLEIRFGLALEIAKHARETVLTALEFEKVYEVIRVKNVATKIPSQRHVVNGAMLSSALQTELDKSLETFQEKKFLRISQGLFNSDSGELIHYARSQYEQAARSMDLLSLYMTRIPYTTNVQAIPAASL